MVDIAGVGGRTLGTQFTIGGSVNAAMLSFTKAMADVGCKTGVQVSAMHPGAVRTARLVTRLQTQSKEIGISAAEGEALMMAGSGITKIGQPEDVANLVTYMVCPLD